MKIKRLRNSELVEKGKELFYDYMSSGKMFFNREEYTFEPCLPDFPTPMDMVYREHVTTLEENRRRIDMFLESLEKVKGNLKCEKVLKDQLKVLKRENEIFMTTNIKNQKALYNETNCIDYTRNVVRFPIDKKINSFYDNLCLEVAFYDDIGVTNGVYEQYAKMKSVKEKRKFITENTEITHISLVFYKTGSLFSLTNLIVIQVLGDMDIEEDGVIERSDKSNNILLGKVFSDFETLTLKEINKIQNNDVKQFLQTKIDLDKEDLKVMYEKEVGNDNYKILKSSNTKDSDIYIRYVCPSTGRVYYNILNMNNLRLSKYYNSNDYSSYIDAWWSITHVGADPNGNKAMIRC